MGGAFIGAGKAAFHLRDVLRKNDLSASNLITDDTHIDTLHDSTVLDWRWLVLRCERRFLAQSKRRKTTNLVVEVLGDNLDINKFSCFVPRTVLEAIADKRIHYMSNFEVIIERFKAAVVFCDASGFTSLCEALDKEESGAEKLGDTLNSFFAPLIRIIDFWGGDIIKFSGDAVTIVWPVDDEDINNKQNASENSYNVDKNRACQLACQCCMELHKNLNYFPTPVPEKFFTLHISVAFGEVTILQVGGISNRWEYVVAGPPMKEIAIGEALAKSGETVVSPSVVNVLQNENMFIFEPTLTNLDYAKIVGTKNLVIHPPPLLEKIKLSNYDVELLKRFIPSVVFKRLAAGHNAFINEIRKISVVFVGINSLDVSTNQGSQLAQRLMQLTQKAAYTMEGAVNKFLVDDKGVIVLIMFGLPPVFHLDDSVRAVLAALRIADGMKSLNLRAKIGVATGRVWCGTVGCEIRKEYTALGDTVNLAARLMSNSDNNLVYCDKETKLTSDNVLEFKALPPLHVKGKFEKVSIYEPTGRMQAAAKEFQITNSIETWDGWEYKQAVLRCFLPKTEYRCPILNVDFPVLDYPVHTGPLFPWEYIEPFMPSLKPWINLGGVAVIVANESEGTQELLNIISKLSKQLNRSIFLCSSMPDEKNINIANVPLLAWRNICSEMINRWKTSPARELKKFSKFGGNNSIFDLSKELIHPSFHWRLSEMNTVVSDLELPRKYIENTENSFSQVVKQQLINTEVSGDLKNKVTNLNPFAPTSNFNNERSVAPIIGSLVNGYATYEPTVLCLHVRTGTSLFNTMDSESWKTAKLVGRIAMSRRWQKIEHETTVLKTWRKRHSRQCAWCQNTNFAEMLRFQQSINNEWNSGCRPPKSKHFPPFLYVVACSDISRNNPDQQELIQWAKECNSFIQLERFDYQQVQNYMAHCLSIPSTLVPSKLLHYVYKISGGISQYIFLTVKHMLSSRAIILIDSLPTEKDDESSMWLKQRMDASYVYNDQFKLASKTRQGIFSGNNPLQKINSNNQICAFKRNSITKRQMIVSYDQKSTLNIHENQAVNKNVRIKPISLNDCSKMSINKLISPQVKNEFDNCVYFLSKPSSELVSKALQFLNYEQMRLLQRDLENIVHSNLEIRSARSSKHKDSLLQNLFSTESKPELKKKNHQVIILQNLSSISFIPELEAAAIFLLERLEPDEQVLAKVASIFPTVFTAFELQIAYPKRIDFQRFEAIIDQLVNKEMFEKLFVYPNKKKLSRMNVNKLLLGLSHVDYLTENNNFYIHYMCHYSKAPLIVYRFTSAVYHEVVRGLLVSNEREELAKIVYRILRNRF